MPVHSLLLGLVLGLHSLAPLLSFFMPLSLPGGQLEIDLLSCTANRKPSLSDTVLFSPDAIIQFGTVLLCKKPKRIVRAYDA